MREQDSWKLAREVGQDMRGRKWFCGIETEHDYVVVGSNSNILELDTGDTVRFLNSGNDEIIVVKEDSKDEQQEGKRTFHEIHVMKTLGSTGMFCLPFLHQSSKANYIVARVEDAPDLLSGVPVEEVYA